MTLYSRIGEEGDSYTLPFIAQVMMGYINEQREASSTYIAEKESALLDFLLELILASNRQEVSISVSFMNGFTVDAEDTQPIKPNGDFNE